MKIEWKRCPACKGERFLMQILNGVTKHRLCPLCKGDGALLLGAPGPIDKLINRLFPEVK